MDVCGRYRLASDVFRSAHILATLLRLQPTHLNSGLASHVTHPQVHRIIS